MRKLQFWQTFLVFLGFFPLKFDEKQSDGCPDQLTYTHQQRDEDGGIGGHAQSFHRHEKTALSASQLQGHEEEHVGEKTGKCQYEDALEIVDTGHQHTQDEEDLKGGEDAAEQFGEHGGMEGVGVLTMQGGNLSVYIVETCSVLVDK